MTTKRTPVRPPPGKGITPAAVAAFREMQRLEESCDDCQHDCADGDCKKWRQLDRVLRHEMRLPPWEWPTYGARVTSDGGVDADAVERYRLLKEAAAAAEAA